MKVGAFTAILIAAFALQPQLALAEPSYPGKGDKTTVYYPVSYVSAAVECYYKAYGRWPANWQEVVDTGMIQVDLVTPTGQVIDPGDGELNFRFDVVYMGVDTKASASRPPALVLTQVAAAPKGPNTHHVPVPPTYRERLMATASYIDRPWQPYVEEDGLRLMMAASMLQTALLAFNMANGRWPTSVDEFFASGMSPLDQQSVNPVTGELFRYDGSPNDLLVEHELMSDGADYIKVQPVDAGGKQFLLMHPY